MFERSRRGQPDRLLQLTDKLPCIKCIQQVDVTRRTAKHGNRKFTSILHGHARGHLIGICSITESKFFHTVPLVQNYFSFASDQFTDDKRWFWNGCLKTTGARSIYNDNHANSHVENAIHFVHREVAQLLN